jgi:hypothetical protein
VGACRARRPAASEKLEIEMESALSPREIQTRIRSGESVADVARVAGVDHERVERFAAPVIAEREHIAGLAMTSSVRRRGETSANRTLRHVLDERLLTRGVDSSSVGWDSYRMDDGRWAVTAEYATGETDHQAVFFFDVAGRYSVAGNDEGRWVLGDVAPGREPQPGQGDDDTEPTIDLSDELALVRAIQDFPPAAAPGAREAHVEVTYAEVVQLARGSRSAADAPPDEPDQDEPADDEGSGLDILSDIFSDQDPGAGDVGPSGLVVETIDEETVLEVPTGDSRPSESTDDTVVPDTVIPDTGIPDTGIPDKGIPGTGPADTGPSDASAVPELSPSLRSQAWEPAIVVDYPVEPSEDDGDIEVPEGSDDPGRPEPPVSGQDRRDEAESLVDAVLFRHLTATQEPAAPAVEPSPAEPEPAAEEPAAEPEPAAVTPEPAIAERVVTEPEEQELPLDLPEQPTPATPPKPVRRKRASVPSWDEIVFGGPKDQSKS